VRVLRHEDAINGTQRRAVCRPGQLTESYLASASSTENQSKAVAETEG